MANMVEGGDTPFLAPQKLGEIGYKIVIYPISLMLAGLRAMEELLDAMRAGIPINWPNSPIFGTWSGSPITTRRKGNTPPIDMMIIKTPKDT